MGHFERMTTLALVQCVLSFALVHIPHVNGQDVTLLKSYHGRDPGELQGVPGIFVDRRAGLATHLQCAMACAATCSCDVMQYCTGDQTCDMYGSCPAAMADMNISTACANNEAPITTRRYPSEPQQGCRFLVSGPCGVGDDQITASSYWCQDGRAICINLGDTSGYGPKWARLNSTNPWGCWAPKHQNVGEYIQVDFRTIKLTTGVVLTGRTVGSGHTQYVTAFKVARSIDCVAFTPVYDALGNEKVFEGVSYMEEVVMRCFEATLLARCIRIIPTTWVSPYMSTRFDILGF